jgi:hypothetical protein
MPPHLTVSKFQRGSVVFGVPIPVANIYLQNVGGVERKQDLMYNDPSKV